MIIPNYPQKENRLHKQKDPNRWCCVAKVQWLHYIAMQLLTFRYTAARILLKNHSFNSKGKHGN